MTTTSCTSANMHDRFTAIINGNGISNALSPSMPASTHPQSDRIAALASEIQNLTSLITTHKFKVKAPSASKKAQSTHPSHPPANNSSDDEADEADEQDDDPAYASLVSQLSQATQALQAAVQGPKAFFQSFQLAHLDLAAWQIALLFDGFFEAIPLPPPSRKKINDSTATAVPEGNEGQQQQRQQHEPSLSSSEIAAAAGLPDPRSASRALHLLAMQGVFQQVTPSKVAPSTSNSNNDDDLNGGGEEGEEEEARERWAHTPRSAFLARRPDVRAALAMQLDEMYAAGSSSAAALSKAGMGDGKMATTTTTVTPFEARFGKGIYEFYGDEEQRGRSARFGAAMKGAAFLDSASITAIRGSFPWSELGPGMIVDVGGGQGQMCLAIAQVQDSFPPPTDLAASLAAHRISFITHDFFTPQPAPTVPQTKDQEQQDQQQKEQGQTRAYILKHVLHNHPDAACVRILQNLVPALEASVATATPTPASTPTLPQPSSTSTAPTTPTTATAATAEVRTSIPLLLAEGIPGYAGNTAAQERTLRRGDMCMWVTLGARERGLGPLAALLRRADSRLRIVQVFGRGVTRLVEVRLVLEG